MLDPHEIRMIQTMARRANASLIFKDVPAVVDDIVYNHVNPNTGYFKYGKDFLQNMDKRELNQYLEAIGKTNRIMYNRDIYDKLMTGKELDRGDLWIAYNDARENGFEYDSNQIKTVADQLESMDDTDQQVFLADIISNIEQYAAGRQDAFETYNNIQDILS